MNVRLKRTTIHLTDPQRDRLERHSQRTGLKTAEIIRWAIDQYMDQLDDEEHRKANRPELSNG